MLLVVSTVFFYLSLTFLPHGGSAAITFVGTCAGHRVVRPDAGGTHHAARQWVAVGLGFVGVLIIIRPGGGLLTPAAIFPLCSALAFSFYQIITRKIVGREHPLTTLFYTALVGTAVTSLGLPFAWQRRLWDRCR